MTLLIRILTFGVGIVIGGIAVGVWIYSEMQLMNILFVALFLPIGIWFVISAFLPKKNVNNELAGNFTSTGLVELPLSLVAALWSAIS